MSPLVLIAAVVSALAIGTFVIGLSKTFSKDKEKKQTAAEYVASITESEIDEIAKEDTGPDPKTWDGYWYTLAIKGGAIPKDVKTPGRVAMIFPAAVFTVGAFIWPMDIIGGCLMAGASVVVLRAYMKNRIGARIVKMEKQLPNLLAGIKFNLQANLTPQQALTSQADEIPSPLGDELKLLREEIAINTPLDTALENMARRVPSKNIEFLISSIRLAISSGIDLDPQITIIQDIIVQRTKITNLLATAVAQVQPAIVVTGVMIPAAFLFSYYGDAKAREFWGTPIGLVCVLGIALLYGIGLFVARKQVDKVKKA